MRSTTRKTFSAEFKLEAAQLVLDKNHSIIEAAKAMNVGKSTMDKWVRQLKLERQGGTPKASPMTPEQIEIRVLVNPNWTLLLENSQTLQVTDRH